MKPMFQTILMAAAVAGIWFNAYEIWKLPHWMPDGSAAQPDLRTVEAELSRIEDQLRDIYRNTPDKWK